MVEKRPEVPEFETGGAWGPQEIAPKCCHPERSRSSGEAKDLGLIDPFPPDGDCSIGNSHVLLDRARALRSDRTTLSPPVPTAA